MIVLNYSRSQTLHWLCGSLLYASMLLHSLNISPTLCNLKIFIYNKMTADSFKKGVGGRESSNLPKGQQGALKADEMKQLFTVHWHAVCRQRCRNWMTRQQKKGLNTPLNHLTPFLQHCSTIKQSHYIKVAQVSPVEQNIIDCEYLAYFEPNFFFFKLKKENRNYKRDTVLVWLVPFFWYKRFHTIRGIALIGD